MGVVKYFSRRSGQELQAEFPLHPLLINATRADGSTAQFSRADFDAEFSQQLPDLPKVIIPHDPSTVIRLEDLENVPKSHHAWFAVIAEKIDLTLAGLDDIKMALAELVAGLPPRPPEDPTNPG